jgi:hypothetical protein
MNRTGYEGAATLANGLLQGKLQKIDLTENEIGPLGAKAIAAMLQTNTSLK